MHVEAAMAMHTASFLLLLLLLVLQLDKSDAAFSPWRLSYTPHTIPACWFLVCKNVAAAHFP